MYTKTGRECNLVKRIYRNGTKKIDKSAEAKRISSQIVKTVIDRTVYHGTNFAPDIVNEIVNNVTPDVGSKLQ
jgi:hypothetical protein